MIGKTVEIPAFGGATLALDAYIPEVTDQIDPDVKRRTVIVLPGGGYRYTSHREAEPVALCFAAAGFNAFVLWYRTAPDARWPVPQLDAAAAIAHVRANAAEYHTDPAKIAVLGFSAGGHLAGCMATMWQKAELWQPLGLSPEDVRPNAAVLCYPVIDGGEHAHRGSFTELTGSDDLGEHQKYSLQNHVTAHCPPTFLWHTFQDGAVPVQNSLLMAQALAAHKVVTEMHIYPFGGHGMSLCNEQTSGTNCPQNNSEYNAGWIDHAIRFLRLIFS